ncbi:hypothetical protein [Plasmodium yoelii yoelii]|uniref:Uncharacterized protein n=1 Tax=Plasmodium yoelii yoelii TaxID=73239 RepID=Q7RGC3_PLAYO|nr:hypothetical protein [Plasmodium yoelii yoelii]
MNNVEHLKNIYINLYTERENISYLSPLKVQYNNLIKHKLFKLINTASVLIGVLKNGNDGKMYYKITQ